MTAMKSIRDLAVPLEEYASVDEDATLEQALRSLAEAQKRVPAGRQPHRAVLVRDGAGHIRGKIGHFVVLRALLPWQEAIFQEPAMLSAGVSDALAQQAMDNLNLLQGDLEDLCERARQVRVRDLVLRETITIDEEQPLVAAMQALVDHQALSLLVLRRGTPVGVLRLSDVFDHLGGQILECGRESGKEG